MAVRAGISLIAIIMLCVMIRFGKPKKSRVGLLLAVYIAAVLFVTLVLRDRIRQRVIELNPFQVYGQVINAVIHGLRTRGWESALRYFGWHSKRLIENGLNVLLFIPFGFLVPLASSHLRRWWKTVLAGFAFSLMIEIIQLVIRLGWFDTSDLFHNTVGALGGYWIYRKWLRVTLKAETAEKMSPI